jgi:hypothetical protein
MVSCKFKSILVTYLLALSASQAFAQTIQLPPEDLFQTTTTAGKVYCGRISGRWVPGNLAKDGETFTKLTDAIKTLKKEIKKATGKAKAKKEKVLAGLEKKQAAGRTKCAKGKDGGASPTPTPGGGGTAPTPTKTPTKTPTPSSSTNCFNGDSTNTSRSPSQCFGIPGSVAGSISRGQNLWVVTRGCQGCHAPKNGKTFSQIQASFSSQPTMAGLPAPSTQDLADYTAYLNRFNLP